MEQNRAARVGLTAILIALIFRLGATDAPMRVVNWLWSGGISDFFISLETGREVRFSPSLEVFSPDFVESPPAVAPIVPLPVFSDSESLQLTYATVKKPDIPALLEKPLTWELCGEEPTVLILHTHGTESYTKNGEDYVETASWRTTNENYNMLSIGAYVEALLGEAGIIAIQDREIHDYPSYNGSYVDAREHMKYYLEEYPTIQLVLDLHRDASESGSGQLRTKATVDGKTSAQLMVVLGTNYKTYEENLSVGLKLHAQLETANPGITRPLQLRGSRFNQDLSPGALIVEVGGAGNTHEEARNAAKALAEAVIALARGTG